MNFETARDEIKTRISCKDYLTKAEHEAYCCPFCGSGTGPNRSGALHIDEKKNRFKCFACDKTGDVIDLFMYKTGTDHKTAVNELANQLGITVDEYDPSEPVRTVRPSKIEETKEPEKDYTSYYRECRERLSDPAAIAYLESRSISKETAALYWIGYDPEADPAESGHPCPRLIIPTTPSHYVARRITEGDYKKINPKGSTPGIFNWKSLYNGSKVVFVTEGVFDALSILEAGSPALALNSTGNVNRLLEMLEDRKTTATLVLCLDNDEAGTKATEKLRDGLQALCIPFVRADICGQYKDPNEAWVKDWSQFDKKLTEIKWEILKPNNTSLYIDTLMGEDIDKVKECKKTGFPSIDKLMKGLYPDFYILAAGTSVGKTTFALQMADQLAEAGHEVLYFSLEQSRLELISKSVSRMITKNNSAYAVQSLEIMRGNNSPQVLEAIEEYKSKISDRLSIIEGNFGYTMADIEERINQHIENTGTKPVVFIDYLQLVQPEEKRQSTKETVDLTATRMKVISRNKGLIIIGISSINRSNYNTTIDFASLKESGNLEFSAAVVWGMQLECVNDPIFDGSDTKDTNKRREAMRRAKEANPRKMEMIFLKNRFGKTGATIRFDYYIANDLYIDKGIKEDTTTPKAGRK